MIASWLNILPVFTNQFGIKSITEMIQDEETKLLLQTYVFNYAQGYYYGHPKPTKIEHIHKQSGTLASVD